MKRPSEQPVPFRTALTLIEMVLALSLVSMVFLIILPQFRLLNAGWDSKEAAAEIQQNARVLQEHLYRHLASARSISALSGSGQDLGFLDFQDAAGRLYRYEVGADGYVYFGPAGELSILAGPVSRFQTAGFSLQDLVNPAADVSAVRLVRIQTTILSPSADEKNQTLDFSVYLRTEPTGCLPFPGVGNSLSALHPPFPEAR